MTDDIVAFIRARLDEDARDAQDAGARSMDWELAEKPPARWGADDQPDEILSGGRLYMTFEIDRGAPLAVAHVLRHDPARVLRGVEAKRRIVERHEPVTETWWLDEVGAYVDQKVCYTCAYGMSCNHCFSHDDRNLVKWPCPTMRDLAVDHSTHPDYRSEWTP